MSMAERYAFFAPIWRVMRDEAMSVEEVERQVGEGWCQKTGRASSMFKVEGHETSRRRAASCLNLHLPTPCTIADQVCGAGSQARLPGLFARGLACATATFLNVHLLCTPSPNARSCHVAPKTDVHGGCRSATCVTTASASAA